jgi:hypothetical protein
MATKAEVQARHGVVTDPLADDVVTAVALDDTDPLADLPPETVVMAGDEAAPADEPRGTFDAPVVVRATSMTNFIRSASSPDRFRETPNCGDKAAQRLPNRRSYVMGHRYAIGGRRIDRKRNLLIDCDVSDF